MPTASSIYQLKITLKNLRPPAWRRILLPTDSTFRELHEVIQVAMGWSNSHLHQFSTKKHRGLFLDGVITDTHLPEDIEPIEDAVDERDVRLCDRLRGAGDRCEYWYDFGDDWRHEVLLEKILTPDPRMEYPICIGGKRQCPPDDCGGPWGYSDLLAILADPKHKEHKEMLEWLCIDDPEEWDSEELD